MRRANPLGTIAGYASTFLLLAGLGISIYLSGGLVFSPGPLSASQGRGELLGGYATHAEFEQACEKCHQPLVRHTTELCMECHTNVAQEIQGQSGLHSMVDANKRCIDCHSEHRGRDFSPAHVALPEFDHNVTHFSLLHHQVGYDAAPMQCSACHDLEDPQFTPRIQLCYDCHELSETERMQQHVADYGEACLDCHDGVDRMAVFEHDSTDFLLEGEHQSVRCINCHQEARQERLDRFSGLSTACATCHTEPEIHAGEFSSVCEECHTPTGWSPAKLDGKTFDHASQGFSLTRHTLGFDGLPLTCKACHIQGLDPVANSICQDCHAQQDAVFVENHNARVRITLEGSNCLDCHDGADRMNGFDHSQVFPLDGLHAETACTDCHGADPQTAIFNGLPNRCVDCHAEPAIHAGFFGLECQECHETSAWSPAFLKSHDFPLDHGAQAPSDCLLCHPNTFTEYTCYGCHDQHQEAEMIAKHVEEGIGVDRLPSCAECHPDGRQAESEGGGD